MPHGFTSIQNTFFVKYKGHILSFNTDTRTPCFCIHHLQQWFQWITWSTLESSWKIFTNLTLIQNVECLFPFNRFINLFWKLSFYMVCIPIAFPIYIWKYMDDWINNVHFFESLLKGFNSRPHQWCMKCSWYRNSLQPPQVILFCIAFDEFQCLWRNKYCYNYKKKTLCNCIFPMICVWIYTCVHILHCRDQIALNILYTTDNGKNVLMMCCLVAQLVACLSILQKILTVQCINPLYALACILANSSCIPANLTTVTHLPVHCKFFLFLCESSGKHVFRKTALVLSSILHITLS